MPGDDTSRRLYSTPSTSSANCSWRVTFSQSSTVTNWSGTGGHTGGRRLPGQINGDAQEASGRAFNLYQVIAQTRSQLVLRFAAVPRVQFNPGKTKKPDNPQKPPSDSFELQNQSTKKKRAVGTRPFGRESWIVLFKALICNDSAHLATAIQSTPKGRNSCWRSLSVNSGSRRAASPP